MSEIADFFKGLLEYAEALRWLVFVAVVWIVCNIISNKENDIEWMDFIATIGKDGKYHGDWDKVGKGVAVVIGSWSIVAILPGAKTDLKGFAIVLGTYFTYAGAVNGWAAYLRSKGERTETTTTTEPVSMRPTKTTTTVVEPGGPATPMEKRFKVIPDNPD